WRLASRYCCMTAVGGMGSAADAAHAADVSRRNEVALGHVVAHQQESASARAFEVLGGGRVGDVIGIEARAFIADFNVEGAVVDAVPDVDLFGLAHLVAMFDGVDEGF